MDNYFLLLFSEVRKAVAVGKRVLIIRDYAFKLPSTFPDKGIEDLVLSSPTIEYMAEFYDQAIEMIREELGPSDSVMKLIIDTYKVP